MQNAFLLSGIVLALLLLCCFDCTNASKSEKIVIVGGGLAGLAAARELILNNYTNVVILEAQNRLGGRIDTVNFDQYVVDLGAMWIHGTFNNTFYDLVKELNISATMFDYDGRIYDNVLGRKLNTSEETKLNSDYAQFYKDLTNYADELDFDVSVQSGVNAVLPTFSKLNSDQKRWLEWDIISLIREEFAEDLNKLSLLEYDNTSDIFGPDALLPTGYMSVLKAMMLPVQASIDIQLSTEVVEIDWSASHKSSSASPISVKTKSGTIYLADRLIVTVPLGVLKRSTSLFNPTLPSIYHTALSKMGMGTLNKVFLLFDDAFWSAKGGDYVNVVDVDATQPWPEFVSLKRLYGLNILVATTTGSHARSIESMSDANITASAMQVLRLAFPGAPDPKAVHITRWNTHPYTYGAYSYPMIGFRWEYYNVLSTPIQEQIYLAGEHTRCDYPATTQGAFLSGQSAAWAIMGKPEAFHRMIHGKSIKISMESAACHTSISVLVLVLSMFVSLM
eukprot:TRINITY_DN7936_c0_g7_i1.p1 TRINITY_DN7936_c0_g7~~TRINITY_DN7936_c0_g7_i1.p1  ORF type:complete len:506 (+),score=53.96 TRINITY_DN7936_c0_g7_i1:61-1578(+)